MDTTSAGSYQWMPR